MNEAELKALIRIVTDYFTGITGEPAAMGLPFIGDASTSLFDYTGLIGISGSRKGGIYFTAPGDFLRAFGSHILSEDELDDESLYDLVGEMTNTISGNLREYFGSDFLISVPIILRGRPDGIIMKLKPPVFVVPIEWGGSSGRLAVGLE